MTDVTKNSREIYIIFSPGRTGSHIILESISGITNTPGGLCAAAASWYPNNPIPYESYDPNKNLAIHTHKLQSAIENLNINVNDVTLILSFRKDLFAQVMSKLVSDLTNEWNGINYSNKPITPVVVPYDEFEKLLVGFQNWPGIIPNLNEYKKVVSIFYEDLVNDGVEHIAYKLNINYNKTKLGEIHRKSPHSYKDWISNWQELYDRFYKSIL